MKRLAIIPARGGSKRLPRKNIRPFHGRPMLHYPISAARASLLFDDVLVSTEDEQIASLALAGGAHVLVRPAELADDHATTAAVMRHHVEALMAEGATLEYVCCIYPCTPFIRPADLQVGFDLRQACGKLYSFPIVPFAPAMQRAMSLDTTGAVASIWPQFDNVRTQDLEPRYHDAGQWYWGHANAWRYEVPIYANAAGLVMERLRAIDIDTIDDWRVAEALYHEERK